MLVILFFFSSRRRHTRSLRDWSSDVCSSDLAVGAKSPQDLLELARFAWKLKGLDVKTTGDFVKVMTLSVAELLEEWFESPQVKAARCVSGAIGTYGGPYTPGTAYVLLHHCIGETDGQMAEWAFVRGGT